MVLSVGRFELAVEAAHRESGEAKERLWYLRHSVTRGRKFLFGFAVTY
jgi:hypothetical protein